MGDDIYEIETQNRGLQILTVNQNNLIKELDQILVRSLFVLSKLSCDLQSLP